jgi:fibrillarin-like rRNA methylase
MSKICDDINQTDQIRFWVSELTTFSPKQVDSVVEVLKARTVRPVDRMAS